MKKYKVIALNVSGKGNKVFVSGDSVTEEQFPEGHADQYVKSGHLKEDGEVKEQVKDTETPDPDPKKKKDKGAKK